MRTLTVWFVLLAPIAILLLDAVIYLIDGYGSTITAVVRDWHEASRWPEFLFLAGCLVLWMHFFRNWP